MYRTEPNWPDINSLPVVTVTKKGIRTHLGFGFSFARARLRLCIGLPLPRRLGWGADPPPATTGTGGSYRSVRGVASRDTRYIHKDFVHDRKAACVQCVPSTFKSEILRDFPRQTRGFIRTLGCCRFFSIFPFLIFIY